jgi:hypothetical protein
MDAIVLREAGGFGDVLQLGSLARLLHQDGYVVHLYTLPDPAIVELANLIRGISQVHKLRMTLRDRRERTDKNVRQYKYLRPALTHAFGALHGVSKNKLFDMFCPGWRYEQTALNKGKLPGGSRAQAFVADAGYPESLTLPTALRRPQGLDPMVRLVTARLGTNYTVYAPWARDRCRCVPDRNRDELLDTLVQFCGPVLVMAQEQDSVSCPPREDVFWFPNDLGTPLDRASLLKYTVGLMWHSKRVIAVDSFALHLSASIGLPTLELSGPTLSEINSKHYTTVKPCKPSAAPRCTGCYYRESRGFVGKRCRGVGCGVIGSITGGDLVSSLEGLS